MRCAIAAPTDVPLAVEALPAGQTFAFEAAQLQGHALGPVSAGLITLARVGNLRAVGAREAGSGIWGL